jgi:hypothetical protein
LKASLFIVLAIILPSLFLDMAKAQDAPNPETQPAPTETKAAPAPPVGPPKFILEFDQNDIATMNKCVGELLFKEAMPLVTKINSQMAPQIAKQAKPQ